MDPQVRPSLVFRLALIALLALLVVPPGLSAQEQKKQAAKQEKGRQDTKPPVITEEILVVSEVPRERPVSTVTVLDETFIERLKPLDLSEGIRYAPGVSWKRAPRPSP